MDKESYKKAERILSEIQRLEEIMYEITQWREYSRLEGNSQSSIQLHIKEMITDLQIKFNEL